MSNPIIELRSTTRVTPSFRKFEEGVVPGVHVRTGKANTFVPYERLREVADELHDIADVYDEKIESGELAAEVDAL